MRAAREAPHQVAPLKNFEQIRPLPSVLRPGGERDGGQGRPALQGLCNRPIFCGGRPAGAVPPSGPWLEKAGVLGSRFPCALFVGQLLEARA